MYLVHHVMRVRGCLREACVLRVHVGGATHRRQSPPSITTIAHDVMYQIHEQVDCS